MSADTRQILVTRLSGDWMGASYTTFFSCPKEKKARTARVDYMNWNIHTAYLWAQNPKEEGQRSRKEGG
ncbi:hypothetical protein TNIN_254401 [Trichonephila inaurata madagascariensis]|uniref:Uncharacterized protein n=1 Tax=Trichonephila inaurata madagascariensis TaxID=2747483 RepID=A0A8X7CQC6_9ARAC|nr:hypothetical protein TNIN_254401 [Trichonephila inaurata madagascariensis]